MCGRDRRVCVFAGSGAVLARDIEAVLNELKTPYYEADENLIRGGRLVNCCTALIVSGGYTSTYVSALGRKGFERIREFIMGGGEYIGICAGAYIAARKVEVLGSPEGLGIINITNLRRKGVGLVNITIVKPDHPIAERCSGVVRIWYKNGPYSASEDGVEVMAKYYENYAAIVCSTYGKGIVVIFSPHPEGSLEGGADPEKLRTMKLLENAIALRRDL